MPDTPLPVDMTSGKASYAKARQLTSWFEQAATMPFETAQQRRLRNDPREKGRPSSC